MEQSFRERQFESPHDGPHLLITAGVHGDEFESIAAARRLIQAFTQGTLALECGKLTLIPVVNEGAYWRGHRTAPDDQLDLARVCPGSPGGTLTERVAHQLSERIQAADFYIDLHTGGTEYSVTPLAGYTLHPNPKVLLFQRQMAMAFNLPLVWGTSPRLDGRSLSVARDANVPAIYTEYLGGGRCCEQGIEACFDGCLNVLAMLDMITRPQAVARVRYHIEDSAPESGHMQAGHPSPLAGFFQPAVTVGQELDAGAQLGTVYDLFSDRSEPILVDQRALVVTLRTFPRVRGGESLGVTVSLDANTLAPPSTEATPLNGHH